MNTLALLFAAATSTFDLPPGLLESVCYVETGHNVSAVHKHDGKGDSLGICQIKLTTARMVGYKGTAEQLMNPKTNIHFAAKYLKHNLLRYHGDIAKAVIAFNRGSAGNLTITHYYTKVLKQWRGELTYAQNQ